MADQEELGDNLFEMAKSNGPNIAFLCAKTTGDFDFIPRQRPTADTIILGDQRSYKYGVEMHIGSYIDEDRPRRRRGYPVIR